MTSHAPAVPRRLIDIAGLLTRARRRKRRPDFDDTVGLHIHDRPIIILKTTAGDLPAILTGACLYDGTLSCNFLFVAPQDLSIISIIQRHGAHEVVIPVHEIEALEGKITCRRGDALRLYLSLGFAVAAVLVGTEE